MAVACSNALCNELVQVSWTKHFPGSSSLPRVLQAGLGLSLTGLEINEKCAELFVFEWEYEGTSVI